MSQKLWERIARIERLLAKREEGSQEARQSLQDRQLKARGGTRMGQRDAFKTGGSSPPSAGIEYLTAEQVAAWLQVSEKTVYRWASDDATMPVLRIGAVVRFPRERLERWLRAREQGPGRPRRSRQPLLPPSEVSASSALSDAHGAPCATLCAESPPEAAA